MLDVVGGNNKMNVVEKINLILKKANISKVNLAKYLGVSRQMVYNYLDGDNLSKLPNEKCQLLFLLLGVNSAEEVLDIEINDDYLQTVGGKIFDSKKSSDKKDAIIDLNGLEKEEFNLINDIVLLLKDFLEEEKGSKRSEAFTMITYLHQFLQSIPLNKELKFALGFFSKNNGFTDPNYFAFDEDKQFIFESIMFSAITLYSNGGASRTKLSEAHKRWEMVLASKKEEKLSRTQELNTAKIQALRELGYTSINAANASEVFDKIAEILSGKF